MAITQSNQFLTVMGDVVVGCDILTLDGSATTITLPVGEIYYAHVLYGMGTGGAGTSATWSGDTLTLSAAGNSTKTHYVFYMGTA